MNNPFHFNFLILGHDTIEVCYYLRKLAASTFDFQSFGIFKEDLRQSKQKTKVLSLGSESFLLKAYGSGNGFPFVMENDTYIVEFGEFNDPSFRVKFRSEALWQYGVKALHDRFLNWSHEMGLYPYKTESISRADFTFDYYLPEVDFDEDSVVSLSKKDNKYRDDGVINGLVYGKSDIVLRIYNKVLEINEQSSKFWLFQLWGGVKENVWRIEWQVRQTPLREFGIRTIDDLLNYQGNILKYLVESHDSLRIKTNDSNRSRWPLHPLWLDLLAQISKIDVAEMQHEIDSKEVMNQRQMRIAISMYGYLKRMAAIHAVQEDKDFTGFSSGLEQFERMMRLVHDPLTWKQDVESRITDIRYGQW